MYFPRLQRKTNTNKQGPLLKDRIPWAETEEKGNKINYSFDINEWWLEGSSLGVITLIFKHRHTPAGARVYRTKIYKKRAYSQKDISTESIKKSCKVPCC